MISRTQWYILYILAWLIFTIAIWPLPLGRYMIAAASAVGISLLLKIQHKIV